MGPFVDYGFDEEFSLVIGYWGEWSGKNMAQTEVIAAIAECENFRSQAIICNDTGDGNAKGVVISDFGL